jgi:integrase
MIRSPLLILMEFHEMGCYCRTHLGTGTLAEVPEVYAGLLLRYRAFIDSQEIKASTKKTKLSATLRLLKYLAMNGVMSLSDISRADVTGYIGSLTSISRSSRATTAAMLREALDWMYNEGDTSFSGRDVLPRIKAPRNGNVISCYTRSEVSRILKAIDSDTSFGKGLYFVAVSAAFLGLRAGDLIRLKFENINWESGHISITQQKTGRPLSLPMIDEVRYALIDYLKNGRHESEDNEYILITCHAPHTRYMCSTSIQKALSGCIAHAGIENDGRHRGLHSLRHSLATNLLGDNVPISAISGILGHVSPRTTEAYIGLDETHLEELSLEVRDVL